jgi:excisionase family DNA binding protein
MIKTAAFDRAVPAGESGIPRLALRPREAAKSLGVSERTLWTWTDSDEVPHIRRGKTILYPVDVLRRWLDEQATAGAVATMAPAALAAGGEQ